ncbi:hypothetical protein ACVWWG_005407 [Bradyrhizobium sp. LB7.2]
MRSDCFSDGLSTRGKGFGILGREPNIAAVELRRFDNPPELGRHAVQHSTLLLDSLGVVVHLVSNGRNDLFGLLDGRVIEALRDPCIVKTEVTVAAVRRRSCGVNGLRPNNSQSPGVSDLSLFFSCFVPRNASAIAFRWIGWPLYVGALEYELQIL